MTESVSPRPSRVAVAGAALLLTVAVAAAYGHGLGGRFVFDDLDSIPGNPSIRHWATAWSPPAGATVSGRPLLNFSFALNYAVSGLAPWSYHLLNLLIHLGAGLLLMGIVRRTLQLPVARSYPPGAALAIATATALLWALHPLQVDAVEYVVQRAESLMGLFYLASLYALVRSAAPGALRTAWMASGVVACLLGMLTKETMATAPLVLFLYDRTFLSGSLGKAWRQRKTLYLALAATWAPLGNLVLGTSGRSGTAGWRAGVPVGTYAAAQLKVVLLYLKLAVWPHPLVGDYGRAFPNSTAEAWACGAAVAVLLAGTVILLVRRPALGFVLAWFFIILAPSSSVIPVATEIMAEHRVYLSLAPLCLLVGLVLWEIRGGFGAGVVLLTLLLGEETTLRVRAYASPEAFWTDVALKVPRNAGAWNNLGVIALSAGQPGPAAEDFRRALAVAPQFATAHFNLGRSLNALHRPGEAVPQLEFALAVLPRDPALRREYGRALEGSRRPYDAVDQYEQAVRLDPDSAPNWFDLGAGLVEIGKLAAAADAYAHGVLLAPTFAEGRVDYGNVLLQLGRAPEAISQYEADLPLEPGAADVRNNLGSLLAQSGRLAEAQARFEEALRLRPDYAEARDNLARVRAMRAAAAR